MIVSIAGGDIVSTQCQAFVCPVNCLGVMGAGLAATTRKTFGWSVVVTYSKWCRLHKPSPGDGIVCNLFRDDTPNYVVCLATKGDWRDPSKLEWIERGVKETLPSLLHGASITSVAIPKIGCGLGGLNWEDVRRIIVETFEHDENIMVHIYE